MKVLLIYILTLYASLFVSCKQKSNPAPKTMLTENKFSVEKKIKELRERGELFDSCQFPYQGNCFYRLCGSPGITSIRDTSFVTPVSSILVAYIPKMRLITNELDKTAHFEQDNSFKIYSHVIFKEYPDTTTFDDFVSHDISYAINRGEIVLKKEEIKTSDENKGIVYEFKPNTIQINAVSYIDLSKYIVMIVFLAKDSKTYNDHYLDFSSLVQSFKYYGD